MLPITRMSLFLLCIYTFISINSDIFRNNTLSFIKSTHDSNIPSNIFNHVSYVAMAQSQSRISQSRIQKVFHNIFSLPNDNTFSKNTRLLLNYINKGVCLDFDYTIILPGNFIWCDLYVKILSSRKISSLVEFE